MGDQKTLEMVLARLVAAGEVVCEAGPGAEDWELLCDALDAARELVPADVLEVARVAVLEETR